MTRRGDGATSLEVTSLDADADADADADGAQGDTELSTSLMRFEDLEEFRQNARDGRQPETEADRVTPTDLLRSPFAVPGPTEVAPTAAPGEHRSGVAASGRKRLSLAASELGRSFREASWVKRATVLLLPFVIALYGLKAYRHNHPRAVAPRVSTPAASAKSVPMAKGSVGAREAEPSVGTRAPALASVAPSRNGTLTLQRRAVDAFASGDYREAAALYERLAAENPDSAALVAASRIAKEKANGKAHD